MLLRCCNNCTSLIALLEQVKLLRVYLDLARGISIRHSSFMLVDSILHFLKDSFFIFGIDICNVVISPLLFSFGS
jgi:hypothetical protein